MSTNIGFIERGSNIPAGIFQGTEVFVKDNAVYAMYQGKRVLFEDLPGAEKRYFIDKYMADNAGRAFILNQFGIVEFEAGFKQWLSCKFGALDGSPDCVDGNIIADAYNSACRTKNCPGRGVFCGTKVGLKGYEVETLRYLKEGRKIEEVAKILCISTPAVKSRINKMKGMFNAPNLVALIGMATDLGV